MFWNKFTTYISDHFPGNGIRHFAVNLAGFLDPILKDKTVREKVVGRQAREIV